MTMGRFMRNIDRQVVGMANAKKATTAADDEALKKISSPTFSVTDSAPKAEAPLAPIKADNTAMLRRYETLRGRAKGEVAEQTGAQQDALQRRFAQLGNLNSGTAMKQQQMTAEQGAQLQQKATEGLDMAQSQEQAQLDADAANKTFARDERIGSQQFASAERAASQGFAAGESAASRAQQERQFGASMAFEKSKFGQQFGEQVRMNNLEEKIQKFNMDMAEAAANQQNMFDRIGNMGTKGWGGISGWGGGNTAYKGTAGSIIGTATPLGPLGGMAGGLYG